MKCHQSLIIHSSTIIFFNVSVPTMHWWDHSCIDFPSFIWKVEPHKMAHVAVAAEPLSPSPGGNPQCRVFCMPDMACTAFCKARLLSSQSRHARMTERGERHEDEQTNYLLLHLHRLIYLFIALVIPYNFLQKSMSGIRTLKCIIKTLLCEILAEDNYCLHFIEEY